MKNDIFTKEKRSWLMSRVKASGNVSTELKLISVFKEHRIKGWRRGYRIKGKPDFVFIKEKIALFVDGCFWHGHDCRNLRPKDNSDYWTRKIQRNKEQDRKISVHLEQRGWRVIRIWECSLKNKNRATLLSQLSFLMEKRGS